MHAGYCRARGDSPGRGCMGVRRTDHDTGLKDHGDCDLAGGVAVTRIAPGLPFCLVPSLQAVGIRNRRSIRPQRQTVNPRVVGCLVRQILGHGVEGRFGLGEIIEQRRHCLA